MVVEAVEEEVHEPVVEETRDEPVVELIEEKIVEPVAEVAVSEEPATEELEEVEEKKPSAWSITQKFKAV